MKHYTFIDYVTQGYLMLVGVLVLLFHGDRVPLWPLLIVAHVIGISLVHLLIRFHATRRTGWLLDFLRHFYPVLLYTGFYRETGELNQMFVSGYLDPFFIRLEGRVFGVQPSLEAMPWLPYLWVSELFYAAYFSYYAMIVGVGLALFRRSRQQFFHYVSVVSFVFYLCYLAYIFTPVMGPRIFLREITEYRLPDDVQPAIVPPYPPAIQTGPFYQLMTWIYRIFEAPGAAFPSSHVAVALSTVWFSFLYLRRIRLLHLVVAVLLCLATIYCRFHYAVDVIAGVLAAAMLVPLGNWLYFKYPKTVQPVVPPGENSSSDAETPAPTDNSADITKPE